MNGQRDLEGLWMVTRGLSESRLRMEPVNADKESVRTRRGNGNLQEKVRVLHCNLSKKTA